MCWTNVRPANVMRIHRIVYLQGFTTHITSNSCSFYYRLAVILRGSFVIPILGLGVGESVFVCWDLYQLKAHPRFLSVIGRLFLWKVSVWSWILGTYDVTEILQFQYLDGRDELWYRPISCRIDSLLLLYMICPYCSLCPRVAFHHLKWHQSRRVCRHSHTEWFFSRIQALMTFGCWSAVKQQFIRLFCPPQSVCLAVLKCSPTIFRIFDLTVFCSNYF